MSPGFLASAGPSFPAPGGPELVAGLMAACDNSTLARSYVLFHRLLTVRCFSDLYHYTSVVQACTSGNFCWRQKLLFLSCLIHFVGCVSVSPQNSSTCCSWKTAVKREEIGVCVFVCVGVHARMCVKSINLCTDFSLNAWALSEMRAEWLWKALIEAMPSTGYSSGPLKSSSRRAASLG